MKEEGREHQYLRLIREENEAFDRANRKSEMSGPAQRESFARDWFAASSKLLKEYTCSQMSPGSGEQSWPYPAGAILRLANLAEFLAAGRIPQPVTDITAYGGRPERWPGERRDIAVALQYINQAKSRAIVDRSYIKTVSEAFSVERTTVFGWQKKSEEILSGIEPMPAEQLPDALKAAGARYHWNRTGERTEGVE